MTNTKSRAVEANLRTKTKTVLSKRVPRIGKVLFSPDADPVACAVKNFSKESAILTMTGWLGLPSQFKLYIEPDNICAHCDVVERRGSNVRVIFQDVESDTRYRSERSRNLSQSAAS
ncbi:MAG: hypothetical protein AAF217_12600 [Pseudomonadota bacterium]